MFLKAVHLQRPELRPEVHNLIAQVWEQGAGARFPLSTLISMLGLRVAPEFEQQLQNRGDIHLNEDLFLNEGPEIRRPVYIRGLEAQFYMAPRMEGELGRFAHSFQLHFRPEFSIQLTRFPFQMELRYLDVSLERVFVEVKGGQNLHIALV